MGLELSTIKLKSTKLRSQEGKNITHKALPPPPAKKAKFIHTFKMTPIHPRPLHPTESSFLAHTAKIKGSMPSSDIAVL